MHHTIYYVTTDSTCVEIKFAGYNLKVRTVAKV
jgi:hypothetical protein